VVLVVSYKLQHATSIFCVLRPYFTGTYAPVLDFSLLVVSSVAWYVVFLRLLEVDGTPAGAAGKPEPPLPLPPMPPLLLVVPSVAWDVVFLRLLEVDGTSVDAASKPKPPLPLLSLPALPLPPLSPLPLDTRPTLN
jgi:hypothetical protein